MLSIEEKRKILNSFEVLTERIDKYERHFYYFYNSNSSRKLLGREFNTTGEGYIYGEVLEDYNDICDDRGWVNVKNFSEEKLHDIINKIIEYHK